MPPWPRADWDVTCPSFSFLGTGGALHNGGPLGLLVSALAPIFLPGRPPANKASSPQLGYTIMGSVCFSVMIGLGEMISYLPIEGGHIALVRSFVLLASSDPASDFLSTGPPLRRPRVGFRSFL